MYPCSIQPLHIHALFASALQRCDDLSVGKIRQAIAAALNGSGAAAMRRAGRAGVRRPPGDRGRPDALGPRDSGCAGWSVRSKDPADSRR